MKIVVIGNGFDLANGLPTSYKDYYVYKVAQLEEVFKEIWEFLTDLKIPSQIKKDNELFCKNMRFPESLSGEDNKTLCEKIKAIFGDFSISKLSFWDVFFWYLINIKNESTDLSWFNVEAIIKNFIFDKTRVKKVCITNIKEYVEYNLLDMEDFTLPSINKKVSEEYFSNIISSYTPEEKALMLFGEMLKLKRKSGKLSIYDILLNELHEYEESFRNYISLIMNDIVTANRKNIGIYRDNFMKLITDNSNNKDFYLLNFNYTCISASQSKDEQKAKTEGKVKFQRGKICHEITEVNVHGSFNKIAIFGIDQSKVGASDFGYIFTKTYRKISNRKKLISFPLPSLKEVDEIVFYGHSLSEADYSYFQSIFDYYDIYHSNIKLTFKYSLYGEFPEINEKEHYSCIIKLIRNYGETMDNINHGNNLVHKLLLENRLEVKEVKLKKIDTSSFRSKYINDSGVTKLKSSIEG